MSSPHPALSHTLFPSGAVTLCTLDSNPIYHHVTNSITGDTTHLRRDLELFPVPAASAEMRKQLIYVQTDKAVHEARKPRESLCSVSAERDELKLCRMY